MEENAENNIEERNAELEKSSPYNNSAEKSFLNKKQNKQIIWAVIIMLGLILIILGINFYNKNFVNQFEHIGLDFQKTKLGNIFFYSAKIPLVDERGGITGRLVQEQPTQYAINFRSDPRELESISFNANLSDIKFFRDNNVFISLSPEMKACEDNSIALINLAGFLREFADLKIKSSVSDENYSKESKIFYATCKKFPLATVINIGSGNVTKIEKTGENCYELTYADCDIIPVTEKFTLLILEGYMDYFNKKPESNVVVFNTTKLEESKNKNPSLSKNETEYKNSNKTSVPDEPAKNASG